MNGINKVILVGRAGKDPESKTFDNGSSVSNIALATSEKWKDKTTGEKKEATEWHKVVFSGRLAEVVSQYVNKGDLLYVEGKNKTNKWTDQNGVDRYQTVVMALSFQIMSSKERKPQSSEPQQSSFDEDLPF